MLAEQRRGHILALTRRDGAVRVSALVRDLGVSDMTIRRDLSALAAAGLVEKVHGGATLVSNSAVYEPGFAAKSILRKAAKRAIAQAAADLVDPGMAIGMSAGTTTFAVAEALCDIPELSVVTNSVRIADFLHQNGRSSQTVLLTGGMRTRSDALVGPLAIGALAAVHVDMVFMGVHGMALDSGFTTPNLLEAETNRRLIEAGRKLVVVADSTKWGVMGISTIAPIGAAQIVISDTGLASSAVAALGERVGELVVVASPHQTKANTLDTYSNESI